MAPRTPIGDKAMSSAERVKRSRWITKFEETAANLLDIINEAPDNLMRQPKIPIVLAQKLIPYVTNDAANDNGTPEPESAKRFLKLGNGNQAKNKRKAIKYAAHHLGADILDKGTLKSPDWGMCRFSAYTHGKGAMISTPNSPDRNFGGKEWHTNDHIILFRETLDGRCIIYVSEIEPLFDKRTIGHHGVRWADIEDLSLNTEVMMTLDVISQYEQLLN